MNPVRQKIKTNFDALESAMNAQRHLDEESLGEVLTLIEACSKYFRVLDGEHKDYLNSVKLQIKDTEMEVQLLVTRTMTLYIFRSYQKDFQSILFYKKLSLKMRVFQKRKLNFLKKCYPQIRLIVGKR